MVSGVRRWMSTSHQTSSSVTAKKSHNVNNKTAADKQGEQKFNLTIEPEPLDRHSTEAMARQSLNPVVPDGEESEYQG